MSFTPILGVVGLQARPGDLAATVQGGRLALPPELAQAFGELAVRSAEDLLAFLETYPSILASKLGWTIEDVERGRRGLVERLRGVVSPELLAGHRGIDRPLGAFDPALLTRR